MTSIEATTMRRAGAAWRAGARVAAVVAVVAGVLAWSSPADAGEVRITFKCVATTGPTPTPPPGGSTADRLCPPAKGQAVDGMWKVGFNVKAGDVGRMRRVQLFLISEQQDVPSPGSSSGTVSPVAVWGDKGSQADWTDVTRAPNAADLHFDWDTVVLTPYNARYTIRIEALSHTDDPNDASRVERVNVAVDNAPATPRPPLASVKEGGRIDLKWAPAPEPDVLWYSVYRARTDSEDLKPVYGEFEPISERIEKTSMSDSVSASGAYWYAVEVARKSVVNRSGFRVSRSDSTARAATYQAPPPTPTPGQGATPQPTPPPPRLPTIVQKPLPVAKPPPVPDAPFSAVLPYSTIPPVEVEVEDGSTPRPRAIRGVTEEPGPPRALPVAVGAFMVSAAIVLFRLPT